MSKPRLQPIGSLDPRAEPAWYGALDSPDYNDSHRALRKYVRDYIDKHVLPFSEEWEEKGQVPLEV